MRKTTALIKLADAMLREPDARHWLTKLAKTTGLATGTVSPILHRLLDEGWLTAEWEQRSGDGKRPRPDRRYLTLTAEGHEGLGMILELDRAREVLETLPQEAVTEEPEALTVGELREAITRACDLGGSYGQNLSETKPVLVRVKQGEPCLLPLASVAVQFDAGRFALVLVPVEPTVTDGP